MIKRGIVKNDNPQNEIVGGVSILTDFSTSLSSGAEGYVYGSPLSCDFWRLHQEFAETSLSRQIVNL